MKLWISGLLTVCVLSTASAQGTDAPDAPPPQQETPAAPKAEAKAPQPNPIAIIKTSMGDVELELFRDQAPIAVGNFLGLAEGTRMFTDAKTGEDVKRPFYDGLTFHQVAKGQLVQGGCPLGTGKGMPGYVFRDEINAKSLGLHKAKAVIQNTANSLLRISSAKGFQQQILQPLLQRLGIGKNAFYKGREAEVKAMVNRLSVMEVYENLGYRYTESVSSTPPLRGTIGMASPGPDSNGCQFFICLDDLQFLAGKKTIFGKVTVGMDVLDTMAEVPVGDRFRPAKPITIVSIREKK